MLTPDGAGPAPAARLDRGGIRLVAALAALNVLSYVDRQLLVALAPLLIADLGLTRAQIGLLVGGTFIVVFALGTLAFGVLADRYDRPRLIAAGLAVWSLATALTATASGPLELGLWRCLVGVGEAGLPPAALSMVSDRVAPRHLGVASSVFYAGVPIGFALSFVLAGVLGPWLGWRACFVVLGLGGLACALLVLRLEDPRRRGAQASASASGSAWSALRQTPTLGVLVAVGVLLVYASAASQHAITWLVAERGFAYARAALVSAGVILAAGLLGSLAIGALCDRARRLHPAGRPLALAGLSACGLAAAFGFYTLPTASPAFFPCWFLAQAYLLGWYGSLVAAVDERAPDGQRATLIGVLLLAINLLGVATGPYVTGLHADRTSFSHALPWSLAPAALGTLLLAAAGLREWRAAPRRAAG